MFGGGEEQVVKDVGPGAANRPRWASLVFVVEAVAEVGDHAGPELVSELGRVQDQQRPIDGDVTMAATVLVHHASRNLSRPSLPARRTSVDSRASSASQSRSPRAVSR